MLKTSHEDDMVGQILSNFDRSARLPAAIRVGSVFALCNFVHDPCNELVPQRMQKSRGDQVGSCARVYNVSRRCFGGNIRREEWREGMADCERVAGIPSRDPLFCWRRVR